MSWRSPPRSSSGWQPMKTEVSHQDSMSLSLISTSALGKRTHFPCSSFWGPALPCSCMSPYGCLGPWLFLCIAALDLVLASFWSHMFWASVRSSWFTIVSTGRMSGSHGSWLAAQGPVPIQSRSACSPQLQRAEWGGSQVHQQQRRIFMHKQECLELQKLLQGCKLTNLPRLQHSSATPIPLPLNATPQLTTVWQNIQWTMILKCMWRL